MQACASCSSVLKAIYLRHTFAVRGAGKIWPHISLLPHAYLRAMHCCPPRASSDKVPTSPAQGQIASQPVVRARCARVDLGRSLGPVPSPASCAALVTSRRAACPAVTQQHTHCVRLSIVKTKEVQRNHYSEES